MGLTADEKDVTISRLAVSLTITGQRADDAEALVASLQAKVKELEEQLAIKPTNGATIDQRV